MFSRVYHNSTQGFAAVGNQVQQTANALHDEDFVAARDAAGNVDVLFLEAATNGSTATVVGARFASIDPDAPINTAPIATNLTQTKGYVEDAPSVALNDIVVTDPDSGD